MTEIDLEEEKREIIRRYRRLLRHVKPLLKGDDAKQIKKAFNMSNDAHRNMRRRSGEPYIFHPLSVAQICVEEIGLGTTSIIAALLHDVVEDTEFEIEDIERHFGKKVAKIVDGLTKISGVTDHGETTMQAENFRKMLLTLSEDVRVILVKLADRLHNMRTLDSMPRQKQLKIASETIFLYAPLAHRLGLYAIKSELEDLHLKYQEPEVYNLIIQKIKNTKAARTRFIRNFINPIQSEIKERNFDFTIKGRPKSIYSIWSKMNKQDIPFEQVYDLFAIRIILDTPPEEEKAACWQVYSIVTDFYQPNPDRLRDWISTPKSNGYESLHTTVMSKTGTWVEVQIRTRRMDEIAEKGYAAHWKYKDNPGAQESGLEMWISKVREMLEKNDSSALEFVDDFRQNLFSEEVFVFTPKGELKKLPGGSTALDFAFEIHSEVGAKCIGAKVNQKLVPITHKLKTGDQIEILTSKKQSPSEDWVNFVVSSKAKGKIKDVLKEQKKEAAVEGKEILRRKLKQIKMDINNDTVDKLLSFFKEKTTLDLYYKIGKGEIDQSEIKKIRNFEKRPKAKRRIVNLSDAKSFEKQITKITGKERDILLIGEDMDIIDYTLAKCCNPIEGDDVFGFVTSQEGIKIHRTNCPNAIELMSKHGHRVVKARWASQKIGYFLVGLRLRGTDRMGIVNDVTKIISNELKVNMKSVSIETVEGIFEGSLKLYIQNTEHLERLTDRLQRIEGVEQVSRFDL